MEKKKIELKPWNPCKLMSLKDIDGDEPAVRMVMGNRGCGKTFNGKTLMLRRYLKYNMRFFVLVRFGYQLGSIAQNFFTDIEQVYFQGHSMSEKIGEKGTFSFLYYDKKPCGFGIALNSADNVKKNSSILSTVDEGFFDEFASENNHYCDNELDKFFSVMTSIGRGKGVHARTVPILMASNAVSIINPYFVQFGIHKRITADTKFMRGRGWVLEQTLGAEAVAQLKNTGIYKCFEGDKVTKYVTGEQFLLDNNNFIETMHGEKKPVMNLLKGGQMYGVWQMMSDRRYLISHQYDPSLKVTYAIDVNTHNEDTALLLKGRLLRALREEFENGNVFFQDLITKNVFLDLIGLLVKSK